MPKPDITAWLALESATAMILHFTRRLLLVSLELMGGLLAGALVLTLLLFVRLNEGPLRIDSLPPFILTSLNNTIAPLKLEIGSSLIDWGIGDRGLGLTINNAHILSPSDAQTGSPPPIASIPQINIGLSLPSLLLGRAAPSRISLNGATLRIIRTTSGDVQFGLTNDAQTETKPDPATPVTPSATTNDLTTQLVDELTQPLNSSSWFGSLRRFEINAARVEVQDQRYNIRWHIPRADIAFSRDAFGVNGTLRIETSLGDQTSVIAGTITRLHSAGDTHFSIHLDAFNPARMAPLTPAFAELSRIDLPLTGELRGRWANPIGITRLDFDLAVGEGQLVPQKTEPPLTIKYAQLLGSIDRQHRRVDIDSLYADFNGPVLDGTANLTRNENDAVLQLSASIENMPAAELSRYWMPNWAKGARSWVVKNITDGTVPKADAEISLAFPLNNPSDIRPVSLNGKMDLRDLTVHYFRPLPPATNANGSARYTLDGFLITLDTAKVGELALSKGRVDLVGLSNHSDRADIDITVKGKLADQLKLLDNKPLHYPSRLGLDSSKAQGTATTRAKFQFPLFHDLPVELVAIAAKSEIKQATLPALVMKQDLTRATINLDLDGAGMTITGDGTIGGAPTQFVWNESFLPSSQKAGAGATPTPDTKITFTGKMDEAARTRFNLAWTEVIADTIDVEGTYTKNRGKEGKLDLALDLTPCALTLPWFGYHKPAGTKASATLAIDIDKGNVTTIPTFGIKSGDTTIKGKVSFRDHSQWETVTLSTLSLPNTQLSGSVTHRVGNNGFILDFNGEKTDISPLFSEKKETNEGRETNKETEASNAPLPPENRQEENRQEPEPLVPLDISFDIKQITTGENLAFTKAKGRITRNSRGWNYLDITGTTSANNSTADVIASLKPTPTGQSLYVKTSDAGSMLSTFSITNNIRGGQLEIAGEGKGNAPVTATASLKNFHYLNTATLERIAREAKSEGADALSKENNAEGLSFKRLKADITYTEDGIDIENARLYGDLLGLTLDGRIDFLHHNIDINGTLVPAYGLNAFVGNLPLLGWILTGGGGGGVFAATFKVIGNIDSPKTSVNPLAILAPGLLREIFFVDK